MFYLQSGLRYKSFLVFLLLLGLSFATWKSQAASKPRLILNKAAWSAKQQTLTIKGQLKNVAVGESVEIFDFNGRRLGIAASGDVFKLSLDAQALPDIPCAVRAQVGKLEAVKKVLGAPKSCLKAPTCQIVSPSHGSPLKANEAVSFTAKADLKDKNAGVLKLEWDFAGGVMQSDVQRMNLQQVDARHTEATFVRDDTRYRVRFSATDAKNRRCEDSVEVVVGTPPTGLPSKVAEQAPPKIGSALAGASGDLVVLPFEDLTMQSRTDARLQPNIFVTIFPYSSLNAEIYQKGRLPKRLSSDQIALSYSAASNVADPAGANSINSTSQNWPVGAAILDAALQKSDMFEVFVPENSSPDLVAPSFINSFSGGGGLPDEGFIQSPQAPLFLERGNFMPGIASPYFNNDPQAFDSYNADQSWFRARMLPVSDIDDSGRINPYPLFRIQARAEGDDTVRAATDTVVTASRDLHCRECHEQGGIAANPETQMTVKFFLSGTHGNHGIPNDGELTFYPALSNRLDDRELSAYVNIASIHDFYDGIGTLSHALGGSVPMHGGGFADVRDGACASCHAQWQFNAVGMSDSGQINRTPYGMEDDPNIGLASEPREGGRSGIRGYDLSSAMHSFHGQLMYNTDKTGIRRLASGHFQRWHPEDGPNPSPLFPVKDAQGKILPMEENCLKCHGGQREQCYRDRMYTAGVTCYQCHGDMLAVGGFYKQPAVTPDGRDRRLPWFDQPDCGSCHIGNANIGEKGRNGFFSPGVMNMAFADSDPSAQPRKPTLGPNGVRFAIPPTLKAVSFALDEAEQSAEGVKSYFRRSFDAFTSTTFRLGKDTHGNVSCAACHGAAHSIWPNREPSANDNVTALQLQGHTGNIIECNVCHDKEAFKVETDLDGSELYSHDPKPGILGGPHNLHPVNDPYWWKSAPDDKPNSDGASYGGWHNNYAVKSGAEGEDQCASCHGNDHKGTRLSKTPVDRVFDFSGPEFNFAQLKKSGFKKKIIKAAAGSVIGCDTCHSIKTSCLNSPNPDCGKSKGHVDNVNHAPVFTSMPITEVTLGQEYHATTSANDPDGDSVSISLTWNPTPPDASNVEYMGQLDFDPNSGALSANWATKDIIQMGGVWNFVLTADDGRGGHTNQAVTVKLTCPNGLIKNGTECVKIRFTSTPAVDGLDAGQTFSYTVKAVHGDGLPLTYSLAEGAPAGMSINSNAEISWTANGFTEEGYFYAEVIASDENGNEARQSIGGLVCVGSQHFDANQGCVGPIHIHSVAPGSDTYYYAYGLDVGQTLSYQVLATHQQNLPLHYSLRDAPASMHIDPNSGLLEWTADAESIGDHFITLLVSDNLGGLTRQSFATLTVCAPPLHWNSDDGYCME